MYGESRGGQGLLSAGWRAPPGRDMYFAEPPAARRQAAVAPSFLVLGAAFLLLCAAAAFTTAPAVCFGVVVVGWVLSLAVHEFAHAAVAFRGGDDSVAEKGYLTLDLTRYAEPITTFVVPVALLLLGGLALPGGAVYIDTSKLRSPAWASAVSAAGPAANFVLAVLAAVAASAVRAPPATDPGSLLPALAAFIYFQVMAAAFNLLPLPPLDGWGIIEPWLPDGCFLKRWLQNPWRARTIALVVAASLFLVLLRIPQFPRIIKVICVFVLGVKQAEIDRGLRMFLGAFRNLRF